MNDDSIVALFTDEEMSLFVKFALVLPGGDVIFDLNLPQAIPIIGADISQVVAYLDLTQLYHDIGVDLASAGPDPMSAAEAFCLKLLWPSYVDCDEKYLAITIAGILSTRCEQDRAMSQLPPYSMHLTEVGMHLKLLEAVDASLAWALPALKQEGLRLARFLGKRDTERYFSVSDSPYHHSDKVVSLKVDAIWEDACKAWSVHDVSLYLRDYVPDTAIMTDAVEITEHLEYVTQSCAQAALEEITEEQNLGEQRRNVFKAKTTVNSLSTGAESLVYSQQQQQQQGSCSKMRGVDPDARPFGKELDLNNSGMMMMIRDRQVAAPFSEVNPSNSNKMLLRNTPAKFSKIENHFHMSTPSSHPEFDGENLNTSASASRTRSRC